MIYYMREITLIIILLLVSNASFAQNDFDREKEKNETINWINEKIAPHFLNFEESSDKVSFKNIEIIKGIKYLTLQQDKTEKGMILKNTFYLFPVDKIDDVYFAEISDNIILIFEALSFKPFFIYTEDGKNFNHISTFSIVFDNSIDSQNLRPRLLKAIKYLIELYTNPKYEKF